MVHELMTSYKVNKESYNHFKNLCAFVSKYIEQNFSPHTSVVINANDFVVKEDIMDGYFEFRTEKE